MKKLLILTALFLSTTLFAQDITNKLGSNGEFYVKDASDVVRFLLSDGKAFLGTSINSSNNDQALNITNNGDPAAGIMLYSSGTSGCSTIDFKTHDGSSATAGDALGKIDFYGWDGSSWQNSAAIQVLSESSPGTGRMQFFTGDGTSQKLGLTIEAGGKVNIATILHLSPQVSAPANPSWGDIYVSQENPSHIYFYNGSAWKQMDN